MPNRYHRQQMRNLLTCLCLTAITFGVYWQVHRFEFVNYDDEAYIYENPHTQQGLTWQNAKYAFRSFDQANYHPMVWISLAADVSLFGMHPRGFHLENVLLHGVNAALLYLFLFRATGDFRPALFSAALFAVHPVHVESVAWVTERKDTLSGLFFMLALLAYLKYTHAASQSFKTVAYAAMILLLIFGLLAKSSLVTFPFVLLLFDYWPLRRISIRPLTSILLEKVPLLLPVAGASVATFMAQHAGGAVVNLQSLPVAERIANAVVSYPRYLGKVFWPAQLSVFYPRLKELPMGWVSLSVIALLAVTIACFRARRKAPFLIIGWLFFLGTLVPMIGLVQVGWQSIADRYLYLAMIGPIMMISWTADAGLQRFEESFWARWIAFSTAAVVLLLLAITTMHQLQFWHDTRTLFGHALDVTPENTIAHLQLGYLDARLGNIPDAQKHYEQAIRIDPTYFVTEFDLANLLLHNNQPALALEHYEKAAADQPGIATIENNWGIALMQLNRPRDAFEHFRNAEKIDPEMADAHFNLGQLFLGAGRLDSAESEFSTTLDLIRGHPGATKGLAAVHAARLAAPR